MSRDENQRIHPTQEAASTSPLIPRASTTSEKKDQSPTNDTFRQPSLQQPDNRAAAGNSSQQTLFHVQSLQQAIQHPIDGTTGPPPQLRNYNVPAPAYYQPIPPESRRGCCCRCICCTFCLILVLVLIVGILALALYLVFKPKVPNYSVDKLTISDLRLNTDLSLYAKFNVRIKAENPNDKIGIYYEKDGQISVWYPKTQTELCKGSIPVFYQGHHNTTGLDVSLTGQNQYGSAFMSALQQQQQTGNVPLDLKVKAPVAIKLGSVKLHKVKFLVRCSLVVNSLSSNNDISIRTSNCRFNLKL